MELDPNLIFINFAKGKFEETGHYKEKLEELYVSYKKALKGGGCPSCLRRRVNGQYRKIIKKLLEDS
tara:strand:+ start:307 stop:507 length:201 start_codon:yes stop_codon:yes gene_type:complete